MSQRTSYSQNSMYKDCPQHWNLYYNEKYRTSAEGASMYFGTAMDVAVRALLEGDSKYVQMFYDRWENAFENGKLKPIFGNDNIAYSHYDFDEHVLDQTDIALLQQWAVELGVDKVSANPIAVYKNISLSKKNPYKRITKEELSYFNRASWLSLKRKGKILIESFKTQFLPKIKRVVAIQEYGKIEDPESGDSVVGFIDMILEIDGYSKPIIFDLKTAASPYTQESIELTDQLTTYAAMKGIEYNTDLVGYVVLCKNIPKDKVSICTNCGHTKSSRHATCDNLINNTRCAGSWKETIVLRPEVQVLVEKKSPEQINAMLQDTSNIVLAMKQKIVYKNTNKCNSWYGGRCPYYNLCHKGDLTGLTKK